MQAAASHFLLMPMGRHQPGHGRAVAVTVPNRAVPPFLVAVQILSLLRSGLAAFTARLPAVIGWLRRTFPSARRLFA